MIFAIVGLLGGILIALDALKNLRLGIAKTTFGTYSRQGSPTAFLVICGIKALMSVTLLILASVLIARSSA